MPASDAAVGQQQQQQQHLWEGGGREGGAEGGREGGRVRLVMSKALNYSGVRCRDTWPPTLCNIYRGFVSWWRSPAERRWPDVVVAAHPAACPPTSTWFTQSRPLQCHWSYCLLNCFTASNQMCAISCIFKGFCDFFFLRGEFTFLFTFIHSFGSYLQSVNGKVHPLLAPAEPFWQKM